jgi:hypothetical protein
VPESAGAALVPQPEVLTSAARRSGNNNTQVADPIDREPWRVVCISIAPVKGPRPAMCRP